MKCFTSSYSIDRLLQFVLELNEQLYKDNLGELLAIIISITKEIYNKQEIYKAKQKAKEQATIQAKVDTTTIQVDTYTIGGKGGLSETQLVVLIYRI